MMTRRHALKAAACGFGSLALAGLTNAREHHPARAKRVIFIFMQGGPSHVDTFDYKPRLAEENGNKLAFKDARKLAKTGMSGSETVMKSPWEFKQYGECGRWVSDLFPTIAQHVDDLTFVH